MNDLANQAYELLQEQKGSWETLRKNTATFSSTQSHSFEFDGFVIKAQFNPERIGSVSAKVDHDSISKRPCFLCDHNRPVEQTSLSCGHGFKLLCNPFPILPEHFTIVHELHQPQRILGSIGAMLDLACALHSRYTVFYNGPQCGASAPDHLHFQAGTRGFLPADAEYDRLKQPAGSGEGDLHIFRSPANYLRYFLSIESSQTQTLKSAFGRLHAAFHRLQPHALEPMMNVMCGYDPRHRRYRVVIFPRAAHRPSFYFATDHTQMMISPGAVDIAGVLVMPLANDFHTVTPQHVAQAYREVSVPPDVFDMLLASITQDPLP